METMVEQHCGICVWFVFKTFGCDCPLPDLSDFPLKVKNFSYEIQPVTQHEGKNCKKFIRRK